ncbi:MAG TPA: thioredoxin family protein [Candidatus Pacearchaeota archaeon]|nr:thioredoxin family protein [Candidatus Pacearchaeota archaeon]
METNLDAIRFSKEYKNVREDNPFVYRSLDEINTILEHGTGVVYLGFPECPWCQKYVQYLNEVANELGVEKIYYFNILQERKSNTESYKKTVSLLENYLLKDDEGKSRIYVPDITVVLNGQIVGHDNEGSLVTKEDGTPDQYWTEQRIGNLKRRLTIMFEKLKEESCSSCHI